MNPLSFSYIADPNAPDLVAPALEDFERRTRIPVRATRLGWDTAWSEMTRLGIHGRGFDVSEIGTTWLGDFVSMNALRTFNVPEIGRLGGQEAFLEPLWQTTRVSGSAETWAIPWLADTRLLYYRRDLFAAAGIDEKSAFGSDAALKRTLQALKDAGVKTPLVIPTHKTRMTLHNAAAWVWGEGAHFASEDGRHLEFNNPEAVAAFCRYFELARFLEPDHAELDDTESDALFWNGTAAVTISGPWLRFTNPEVMQKCGVTFPPGRPFVGGSNLVVWRHTLRPREALELVSFLSGRHAQEVYFSKGNLYPVRLDVLASREFLKDPLHAPVSRNLNTGRSFRLIRLWGMVEERLTETLGRVWLDVLKDPAGDVEPAVRLHLDALAGRLNLVLGGG